MLICKWLGFQLCSSAIVSVGIERGFCTFWKWDNADLVHYAKWCPVEIILSVQNRYLSSHNHLVSREAFCLCNWRKILICLRCLNVYIRVFLITKWKKGCSQEGCAFQMWSVSRWLQLVPFTGLGAPTWDLSLWWYKPLLEYLPHVGVEPRLALRSGIGFPSHPSSLFLLMVHFLTQGTLSCYFYSVYRDII